MSVLSKQQVKIAAPKRSKFNLDAQHITTSQFMQLHPVYYRNMIPNEKISVDVQSVCRLAPLAVPTFGRANLNLRAFFVPYRTIVPFWNEFISDTIYSSSSTSAIPTSIPKFNCSVLWNFISVGSVASLPLCTVSTSLPTVYDFYDSTNSKWYSLTPMGRYVCKILNSLGYRVILPSGKSGFTYNALALLSYCRVFFDWYSSAAYRNSSLYLSVQKLFSKNDPTIPYSLTATDLTDLFSFVVSFSYDQDYFTSAWDNPVSPNNNNSSQFSVADITGSNDTVGNNVSPNATPLLTIVNSGTSSNPAYRLSEYSLHLLHSLNNYVKRNSMSGARAIDRMLVQYGIQLRSEKLNRSVYLGSSSSPLQIGDVTATANTAGSGSTSNLGDYAGRGHITSQKSFDYESDEFGLFLICAAVVPAIGYVQGYDRNNTSLNKFDFFNGSFDNLGVQSVEKGELYVSENDSFAPNDIDYKETFGFLPTYAHYKVGRDWLTGDFAYPSGNVGGGSWHLFRTFSDLNFLSSGIASIAGLTHSLDFTLASDRNQFNRIFNNTLGVFDNIYMFFNFNVTSYIPALPLYDTYQFECEDDHESVIVETNGTQLH